MTQLIHKILLLFICLLIINSCAKDPVIQYELKTLAFPTEGGAISPTQGSFKEGESVTITAKPFDEYLFIKWSDGVTGTSNSITLTMNSNKNITATFEKRKYPLSLNIEGEGTVKEEVIQTKSANIDYPSGTIVKLTAVPNKESEFVGWSGDYQGSDNSITITIDKSKTFKATFKKSSITIDYSTKYTPFQNISFSRPFIIPDIHMESLKIIDINGKKYLITSNADLFGTTYDFFRSYSIDINSGLLIENTSTFFGGYFESGFPKSPFWYEDLNGDNLKDLFISDHGKETPSLMVDGKFPGFVCHLFLANPNGTFSKGNVDDITLLKRFYHSSGVGDVDSDGRKDLVVQAFSSEEIMLFLNSGEALIKKMNITPNNQTGSVWVGDVDGDNQTEIISAPYIDRGTFPSTYIKKIKINGSSFSSSNISQLNPFGDGFGCYKIIALKNPKNQSQTNIFYFVESGIGSKKIFRSIDGDVTQIEEIIKVQSTTTTEARDFEILDLNFDGIDDIFFYVNPGQNLNSRVWLNKGDNTFENPNWDIDTSLKETFIPLSFDPMIGRTKFLYYGWNGINPSTKIIDVYTKIR